MKSKLAFATFIAAMSLNVLAVDTSNVVKSYELKDGSKLHIFKDGKMAMERSEIPIK